MKTHRVTVDLASVIAVLVITIAGGFAARSSGNEAAAWRWVTHTREVLERLQEVVSLVRGAESAQRGFLLTGRPEFLAELRAFQASTPRTLDTIAELTIDNPRQQAAMPALRQLAMERLRRLDAVVDIAGGQRLARPPLEPGGQVMTALERRVATMMDEEHRLLATREAEVQRARAVQMAATLGVGVLALLLVVVLRAVSRRDTRLMAQAAARIEAVFRAAPVGLGIIGRDLRLGEVNHALARVLGAAPQALRGRLLSEVAPEPWGERLAAICRDSLASELPIAGRELARPPTGDDDRQRDWLASVHAVSAPAQASDLVLAMLEVTPLKAAERELAEANGQLESRVAERTAELTQLNEDLQAFAHTIAHDLRAPLRNIEGFSSAVVEDEAAQLSDEGRAYLARIQAGVRRMDQLITDLLAYSRLARGQLRPERVELREAVADALRELESTVRDAGATVEVPADLPAVLASRGLLVQVLVNLLSNAVKFVRDGARARVRLRATRTGTTVRLVIDDDGIGIAPQHRERVFGVFERLHGSEAYPGTGIGLAIVRRAITKMQGTARVEESPEGGTRIVLSLPAAA